MIADPDRRRRDMAVIHIAKKQLGMDEETYRDMLWTVARVRSSADLDYTGLQRVMAHLRACGFKSGFNGKKAASKHGAKPQVPGDRRAQIGKLEALLADAGRPWDYLTQGTGNRPSMVKRICGVDRIEFATSEQLGRLIAALTYDQRRRGGQR